jgi:protein-disulfide isomerase
LLERNATKVKIVFKNFPLRSHPFAAKAAIAALAAGRQGKFWEFHDALFKEYSQINDEKILEIARQLGLNEVQFKENLNDQEIVKKIQADIQEAYQLGVDRVPTVFINGKRNHARTLDDFQAAVEEEFKGSQKPEKDK